MENKNPSKEDHVQYPSSFRIWQAAAVIFYICFVIMTGLFIWQSTERSKKENNSEPSVNTEREDGKIKDTTCPKQPPLLDLPDPLPSDITQALEKLDSHLKSLVAPTTNVPAISANVFYKGKVVWTGYYGSKSAEKSETPDSDTVYRIGSVTKIFPVLLLFKLYEEGVISSVDDPLHKYVPDFAIKNPFSKDNVTLRQLANQLSGLPREAPCGIICSNTNTSEQLVLLRDKSLIVEPGTYPSYSNLAYILLGRLLTERLLNTTFEAWTTANILQPLGMLNTGFGTPNSSNMAPVPMFSMDLGWFVPAGDMYSTVADLTKLGNMFTQPGKQNLLKEQTIRQILQPDYITRGGEYLWGAPWEMRFMKGFLVVGKAGGNTAFTSVVPELELGMNILMSVSPGTSFLPAVDAAYLAYSAFLPVLNETLFTLQKDVKDFPINPKPFLGKFQGTSLDPTKGVTVSLTYTVTVDKGFLLASDPTKPDQDLTLSYIGEPLILRSRPAITSGSCLIEHTGLEYGVYFSPPDSNGLSQEFKSTWMTLTRVKGSQEL